MFKVLVVDDDPAVVGLLKAFLEKKNCQVLTAYDGVEALQRVQENNPQLVLLDVYMPKKDGLEVLKEIKQYKNISVVMITAATGQAVWQEALARGALDYITKPCDLSYLEKILWWISKQTA
ncbi:MAG: response regulator [Acidobacteria bacterium]|nr:response regulator [Acidobacteriota bacterium]